MVSDRLYRLALEFRKTSLWKRMEEDQLFAVELAGKRIGYVSVMGLIGEHMALALYAGEEGLRSYHILREFGEFDEIDYSPAMQMHASIQVSFEAKDDLPKEVLAEAKDYAKRNGIRFSGKNAYPMFFKAEPGFMIMPELTEQDEDDLAAALEGAIEVAKDRTLSIRHPGDFPGIDRKSKQIVLVEKEGGSWNRKKISLPAVEEYRSPDGKGYDELAAARILKLRKSGVWQAGLMTSPRPMEWERSEGVVVPVFLVVLDKETDQVLPVRPVGLYESRSYVMLNMFMQAIEENESRPAAIEVEDEFTETLLQNWGESTKTRIVRRQHLPELHDAKWSLVLHLGGGSEQTRGLSEMIRVIDGLLTLPMKELAAMPEEMKDQLLQMEEAAELTGSLPDWVLDKLGDLNDAIEEAELRYGTMAGAHDSMIKAGNTGGSLPAPRLCVLSVSIGTGCYRHLQLPENILLAELADSILWSFGFVNDHAHAFFMDNRKWSHEDCYYSPGIDEFSPQTDEYTLQDTEIWKGKPFKFVFDFGDEWVFQCKVLRISDGPATGEQLDAIEMIRCVGKPPQQYGDPWFDTGDWDEDDWDDED